MSFLIVHYSILSNYKYPFFNREISAFYAYRNTNGFEYKNSIKKYESEPNAIINSYGFIYKSELNVKKDSNEIRIFICGGSGAFGNGQSVPYDRVKKYPNGLYSFESSISGLLEKKLNLNFPDKKFVVVNACASGRMLNQSIGLYLETIKDFEPDIVISIDGMNDISTLTGLSPYEASNKMFQHYLKLYQLSEEYRKESLLQTINLFRKYMLYKLDKRNSELLDENADKLLEYNIKDYTLQNYEQKKNEWIKESSVFTNLILYFNSICKVDNVDYVFCLQPMLNRTINKKLTETEVIMQQTINPINIRLSDSGLTSSQIDSAERNGNLLINYFFDDVLTKSIDSLSKNNNFGFIDFNQEIENEFDKVEFYVDYCHLTHEGNSVVAEILSQRIVDLLVIRKLIQENKTQ